MRVLLVTSNGLGRGDEALGEKLMASFFYALVRTPEKPDAIVFMNAGVRLTTHRSPLLSDLRLLVADGVKVYSCGTCLDFYDLRDKLAVGEVGNMNDTVAMTMAAQSVVTIG